MKKNQYNVQVLEKALIVIETLFKYPEGISLTKLSSEITINKTTVYRILITLKNRGYVEKTDNYFYKITYKFHSLLSTVPDANLQVVATKYLPLLAIETSKVPFFYVKDGDYSVCIAKYDSFYDKTIKINVNIGERTNLYSTSGGKIFLAAMNDKELTEYLSRTELIPKTRFTITDKEKLLKNIVAVRRLGYSINNQENEENIISVAAPIKDYNGNVVAAINAGDTILEFSEEKIPDVAKTVILFADKISRELGYFKSPKH